MEASVPFSLVSFFTLKLSGVERSRYFDIRHQSNLEANVVIFLPFFVVFESNRIAMEDNEKNIQGVPQLCP